MNRLKNITNTLNSLKEASNANLSITLEILKVILQEDSQVIADIKEVVPGIDNETIFDSISTIVSELAEDSERVVNEIESFTENLLDGSETLDGNQQKYEFLYQVWSGDVYDDDRIKGMKLLEKDIKSQTKNLNDEYIRLKTIENLTNH